MPFQPVPTAMNRRDSLTMLDLIQRRGDIAAQGALRSGEVWGNTLGQLGQLGSQAFMAYNDQKQADKQGEALSSFLTNLPENPEEILRGSTQILGPDGVKFAQNVMDFRSSAMKTQRGEVPTLEEFQGSAEGVARMFQKNPEFVKENWSTISQVLGAGAETHLGVPLGQEWRDDYGPAVESFLPSAEGPKEGSAAWLMQQNPETRAAYLQAVQDQSAAGRAPEKQPDVGSFERYVVDKYGPQASPEQVTAARASWADAAREPATPRGGDVTPQQMEDMLAQAAPGWREFNGTNMTSDDFSIRSGLTRSQAKTAAGKAGVVLPSKKLGEATLAAQAELADINQVINDLEDPKTGPVIKKWIGKYKGNLASFLSEGWLDPLKTFGFAPEIPPEIYDFRANLNSIAAAKRHEIYGAAVTGTETPFARGFIPAMNQSYEAAYANVKEMRDTIERGLDAQWGTAARAPAEAGGGQTVGKYKIIGVE